MRSSPLLISLVLVAAPAAAQPAPPEAAPPAPASPEAPPVPVSPGAAPADATPTAPAPAPSAPETTPPATAPPSVGPAAPPHPVGPAPHASPRYGPGPTWAPGTPPGSPHATAPRTQLPPAREEVHWFARVELGIGGPGLQENNQLLNDLGYARVKMWATLDAAYMFHRHVGAGIWMGINRRSSQPSTNAADLNLYGLFIGGELPIKLWGKRAYTFHLTPRVGYLNGKTQIDNGFDATSQHAPIFGAAASFQSFTYHVGASVGWMFAPAGAPGDVGRDHDYGGIYAALGGTIDG